MNIWDIGKPKVEKRKLTPRKPGNGRQTRPQKQPESGEAKKPDRPLASEVSRVLKRGKFPKDWWRF